MTILPPKFKARAHPTALPFEQLTAIFPLPEKRFEEVISHILRKTVPDAKLARVHLGDGLEDTFTGEWGTAGALDVYQIKIFTTKWSPSQRQEIIESFQTACGSSLYNLIRWILVVPVNPTAADYDWFYSWKAKTGADIGLIDGSELLDRLRRPECNSVRELLKKWGIVGVVGGTDAIPLEGNPETTQTPPQSLLFRFLYWLAKSSLLIAPARHARRQRLDQFSNGI